MNKEKYKNKGIKCIFINCNNLSQIDNIPYHRYPKDKEQLVSNTLFKSIFIKYLNYIFKYILLLYHIYCNNMLYIPIQYLNYHTTFD